MNSTGKILARSFETRCGLSMLLIGVVALLIFLSLGESAKYVNAHFFGQTWDREGGYQLIFAPYPENPVAGSNSTLLNFSILRNGSNINNVNATVLIIERSAGVVADRLPHTVYNYSDITIPYTFRNPGEYTVILSTNVPDDPMYDHEPLDASFALTVGFMGDISVPTASYNELLLYIIPALGGIGVLAYLLSARSKRRNDRRKNK